MVERGVGDRGVARGPGGPPHHRRPSLSTRVRSDLLESSHTLSPLFFSTIMQRRQPVPEAKISYVAYRNNLLAILMHRAVTDPLRRGYGEIPSANMRSPLPIERYQSAADQLTAERPSQRPEACAHPAHAPRSNLLVRR